MNFDTWILRIDNNKGRIIVVGEPDMRQMRARSVFVSVFVCICVCVCVCVLCVFVTVLVRFCAVFFVDKLHPFLRRNICFVPNRSFFL